MWRSGWRKGEAVTESERLIRLWVDRFNAADADGLANLYHMDATNHQVVRDPVVGRDAIRAMFATEFADADMVCIIEAIHVAPSAVTLEWRDPLGLRGCGIFTIEHGLIRSQRGYWDRMAFLEQHAKGTD